MDVSTPYNISGYREQIKGIAKITIATLHITLKLYHSGKIYPL